MAELNQMSINETSEEENISLEKQEAMQEEAKASKDGGTQERPEWLPEKFKDASSLAQAYQELESKQGGQETDDDEETTEEDEDTVNEVEENQSELSSTVETATEEFLEQGELSNKTYKALEKAGLPRDLVDNYVAGQEAISTSQAATVMDAIGGEGNYAAMSEWAEANLSKAEVAAYDEIVTSGSIEQASMAARGLFAQFRSDGGKAPNLVQGTTSGSAVKPFSSAAQVTEAMRDSRYQKDPAYRQTVEQRLSVTTAF